MCTRPTLGIETLAVQASSQAPCRLSHLAHRFFVEVLKKGKGIPITGHEGPRGMWMQRSTYSQPRH